MSSPDAQTGIIERCPDPLCRPLPGRQVYVTHHAVERFRQTFGYLEKRSIYAIFGVLVTKKLPDEVDFKRGNLLYSFKLRDRRCVAVVGPGEGDYPVVVTIWPNYSRLRKYLSWRVAPGQWMSRDSRRLDILRAWGFAPKECAEIMGKTTEDVVRRWG